MNLQAMMLEHRQPVAVVLRDTGRTIYGIILHATDGALVLTNAHSGEMRYDLQDQETPILWGAIAFVYGDPEGGAKPRPVIPDYDVMKREEQAAGTFAELPF